MRSTTTLPTAFLYTRIDSSLGELLLTSLGYELTGVYFTDQPHAPEIGFNWKDQPDAAIFIRTARQLDEYASGKRKKFDLATGFRGTPFQLQVWKEIATIPFGETRTYSDLAERVGSPHAVRAVGAATGANPLSIIVPCHRVVGKDGSLTGYAGGMGRKTALLDFETGKAHSLLNGASHHPSELAVDYSHSIRPSSSL